jgi:CRP-like cAMP-binding protein
VVDRSLLADVDLFRGIAEDDLDALIAGVEQRSFSRGDVIFTEGDEPTELFVVVSAASRWRTSRSTDANPSSR